MMGKALSGELSCMQTDLVMKENNFYDFLFASLDDKARPKLGLLLMERICSWRSKFFSFKS